MLNLGTKVVSRALSQLERIKCNLWFFILHCLGVRRVQGDIVLFWAQYNDTLTSMYNYEAIKSCTFYYHSKNNNYVPMTVHRLVSNYNMGFYKGLKHTKGMLNVLNKER